MIYNGHREIFLFICALFSARILCQRTIAALADWDRGQGKG